MSSVDVSSCFEIRCISDIRWRLSRFLATINQLSSVFFRFDPSNIIRWRLSLFPDSILPTASAPTRTASPTQETSRRPVTTSGPAATPTSGRARPTPSPGPQTRTATWPQATTSPSKRTAGYWKPASVHMKMISPICLIITSTSRGG